MAPVNFRCKYQQDDLPSAKAEVSPAYSQIPSIRQAGTTMITTILTLTTLLFLAAHALRTGSPGGAMFWLIAVLLAILPGAWKSWGLAGLLGFGTWFWADITSTLVQQRIALGQPWLRLAAILGSVALLCLAAALMNWRRARCQNRPGSLVQGLAFLLTISGLAVARQKAPFDIILFDRFFPGGGWLAVILLGCYAAWVAGRMLQPDTSARWRRTIWLLFSAVFFPSLPWGCSALSGFS